MVTIVDPHIKRDAKYAVHKEATAKGLYIKDKDGNVSRYLLIAACASRICCCAASVFVLLLLLLLVLFCFLFLE